MENAEEHRKRQHEFAETYEDFETAALIDLVMAAGDFLERLTWEPEAVDKAMKALYDATSGYASNAQLPWREIWKGASWQPGAIKTSDYFMNLNAFAYFGLPFQPGTFGLPNDQTLDKKARGEKFESYIQRGRSLLASAPSNWANVAELERTLLAAEARLSLDLGRDASAEQLAALARMSVKSIRNLLTPKSGEADLRLNQEGGIPAADALRWLSKRPDFKPSIWWAPANGQLEAAEPGAEVIEEAVFVPVARDGTWFHPTQCRNSRGYTIGAKGAEMGINDYFDALATLVKAPTPHWRRPNQAGKWGIVAGVSWQRRDAAEIRKLLVGEGS